MNKRGLGRFFNTVKGTATGVLDTASKTAATVVQASGVESPRSRSAAHVVDEFASAAQTSITKVPLKNLRAARV